MRQKRAFLNPAPLPEARNRTAACPGKPDTPETTGRSGTADFLDLAQGNEGSRRYSPHGHRGGTTAARGHYIWWLFGKFTRLYRFGLPDTVTFAHTTPGLQVTGAIVMGEVVKALHTVVDIGLQDASLDIWDRKYR
ncbi:MAG: hypothetical protein RJQ10_10675, partial [Haliea sp.]|uniref:hypothetical protein n=1 Tax=Haliea sp. TaxID=1932666 RepID=UPI0032EB4F4C